ncbi:MAG: crossover junction endodeoxyribonuclease RuvC [Candidatus Kaiserbacteria bacterium]|nr:crossover junction endodeoxyribonuclease RuvC [Candidatus Kaiserbacteria bacterium]
MRVLAIDPGFGRCGIAVLEKNPKRDLVIYSDCIETPASASFPERLAIILAVCEAALRTHRPDCLAMEKLYFKANRTTALKVAEVRGAIIALAGSAGLPFSEYSPAEVKSATAGYGKADKKQIAAMVRVLVSMEKEKCLDDEYDAIAVGITHLASAREFIAPLRAA